MGGFPPILLIGYLLNHDLAIAKAKANHDDPVGRRGTGFSAKSLKATNGPYISPFGLMFGAPGTVFRAESEYDTFGA